MDWLNAQHESPARSEAQGNAQQPVNTHLALKNLHLTQGDLSSNCVS